MFQMNASMAAKEILVCLAQNPKPCPLPANMVSGCGGKLDQQINVMAWLHPEDLAEPFSRFADRVASPIAADLSRRLPADASYVELELPKGMDCAGESYRGYWLRVVIDECCPIPGTGCEVWSRRARYYDVEHDQFRHGKCGVMMRVDICPIERG